MSGPNDNNAIEVFETSDQSKLNEMEHLAMLANSQARLAVGRYRDELASELTLTGRRVFDIMMNGVTSEGQMVSSLLSNGLNLERAQKHWKRCQIYECMPANGVSSIIGSLDKFVRTKLMMKHFRAYEDSKKIDSLVEGVMQLTPLNTSCIPVFSPGEMDIDQILAQCHIGRAIPSTLSIIQNSLFKGYMPGQVICIGGPPGGGKSNLMLQETFNAAKLGFKVYYIAMGDLMPMDIYHRACSMILGMPLERVILNLRACIENPLVQEVFKNVRFTLEQPGKITPFQLAEFIKHEFVHLFDYDLIVVDYDANVKVDEDKHMYKANGDLYDLLASLARPDSQDPTKNKVVMVGSQIKNIYYQHEKIPLDAYAESGKKGHIIDMGITVSHVHGANGEHLGFINQVKSRRGKMQPPVPYMLNAFHQMEEIALIDYKGMRGNVEKSEQMPRKIPRD